MKSVCQPYIPSTGGRYRHGGFDTILVINDGGINPTLDVVQDYDSKYDIIHGAKIESNNVIHYGVKRWKFPLKQLHLC